MILVIQKLTDKTSLLIPYRRPKWDSLNYACSPVRTVESTRAAEEVYNLLPLDSAETKIGVERANLEILRLSALEEAALVADATAISLSLKRIIGGFESVYRLIPCRITGTRLDEVVDRDPGLNIELPYPMSFEHFSLAYRLAFERTEGA
jgi:hypothetical protein